MIREKLQKVGFTIGESEIYELLVESGETKAGTLIKQANITSSKVYNVLQRLIYKGLVSFVEKEGIKYYQATPPERLNDFLEEKKIEITETQDEMNKIINLIEQKNKDTKEKNTVRMYLGKQGPKIVLKELAEASVEEKYNYGYGTQDNPFLEMFPHDMKEFFEAEKKYKLKTQILFAKGKKQKQPNADIRYISSEFITPVRTMIAGNKLFMIDFTDKITSIIIENKSIAQSYKEHFRLLWKIAKK
ncbi:helix-turn-helix domain-containing protein [Candidatus Pacearchaeota archaeon]|nr:helix-turn-helix domain-containing protein [Candidatus Pacearchaeota archaeon]